MRTIKLKDNNYWDTSSIMHNKINLKELLNAIFPIGKVEIFYDSLDHSDYFGFTWERCSLERSPIGYNPNSTDNNYKTIGNKFGEKTHKSTVNEIPSHSHPMINTNYKFCGIKDIAGISGKLATSRYGNASEEDRIIFSSKNDYGDLTIDSVTGAAGGSQAHNTIHPVEVMAFWKRVS